jgi:hypothetical protein
MRIKDIITESKEFTNWQRPTEEDLRREYRVEYQIKSDLPNWLDHRWENVDEFLAAADQATVITVTPDLDRSVEYRSRTTSPQQLRDLVSQYRSWPEFRNDNTLRAIYDGFRENRPMALPIIVKYQGDLRIMSGNTRMDAAQHLGITPRALLITVDS